MSLKGLLVGAAAILASSAVLPAPVLAEGDGLAAKFAERRVKKRESGAFFDLFGQPRRRAADVRIFSPGKRKFSRIFSRDKLKSKKKVEIAGNNAKKPSASAAAYTVPESTYVNLVYQPVKLEPLSDPKFVGIAPFEAMPAAIHAELSRKDQKIRVTAEEKSAALAVYQASGFKPLWVTLDGVTPRGRAALDLLAAAAEEGLDTADYLPAVMGSFNDPVSLHRGDAARLAQLDLGLTAAALAYARHMTSGRIIPDRLTTYYDIKPAAADPAMAMRVLGFSPAPETWLAGLAPKHPAYGAFKTALAEFRKNWDGVEEAAIPSGRKIKPGQSDQRVALVRTRLERMGLYKTDRRAVQIPVSDQNLFDRQLVLSVKAFQLRSNLKVSGMIDAPTTRALNDRGNQGDMMRLVLNMDRMRWLPDDLGDRHVIVNQAAFKLRVQDGGKTVWETKVVVGKPNTQTVAFHDEIETVVFNPTWGVPPSIMAGEMLPRLRRDPGYLDRQGFQVVNSRGKVVRSSSVNWSSYGAKVPFSFIQPAGGGNALGEVKFLFPNRHDIYMHDTPSKNLFSRPARAFSHGCVRVENPRIFAEVVTGLNQDSIESHIATRKSHSYKLARKLPVHITYFTAWPDADGRIEYFADIYGRDGLMEKALTAKVVAQR